MLYPEKLCHALADDIAEFLCTGSGSGSGSRSGSRSGSGSATVVIGVTRSEQSLVGDYSRKGKRSFRQASPGRLRKGVLVLLLLVWIAKAGAGVIDEAKPTMTSLASPPRRGEDSTGEEEKFDMHLSPLSDIEDDTNSRKDQDAYSVSNRLLLPLLLLPMFGALCYQEDFVRLARASRVALDPHVAFHLAFIRHMVREYITWREDWYAEQSAQEDLDEFYDDEFPNLSGSMCLSCGMRPGTDRLGGDECYECYSEH